MAFCKYQSYDIYYELAGAADKPVIVFINGLTQPPPPTGFTTSKILLLPVIAFSLMIC